MILGVPIANEFVELISTNIVDTTPVFAAEEKAYNEGDKTQHEGSIYYAVEPFAITEYNSMKCDYDIGDAVIYVAGEAHALLSTEGEVPYSPTDYGAVETENPWHKDLWNTSFPSRFIRLTDGTSLPITMRVDAPGGQYALYTFIYNDIGRIYTRVICYQDDGDYYSYSVANPRVYECSSNLWTEYDCGTINVPHSTDSNLDYEFFIPHFYAKDSTTGSIYMRSDMAVTQQFKMASDVLIFSHTDGTTLTPVDVGKFSYLEATDDTKPFDGRNNTLSKLNANITFRLKVLQDFNMMAFGYVKGASVDVEFMDNGNTIHKLIDCSRDTTGAIEPWYTSTTVYSSSTVPKNSYVDITINTIDGMAEIGTLLPAVYVDAGMTNLAIKSGYKDFSVFEYDPWGNAQYIDRSKVSVVNGSVDLNISDYDRIDRLLTSLGKNVVILDGNDNVSNAAPDSTNIFAAYVKIGRMMSFQQSTKVKYNAIDPIANYTFTHEEIT